MVHALEPAAALATDTGSSTFGTHQQAQPVFSSLQGLRRKLKAEPLARETASKTDEPFLSWQTPQRLFFSSLVFHTALSPWHVSRALTGRRLTTAQPWPQVVLYEDHSRKRLLDFLAALKGLREVAAAAAEFDAVTELESDSPRLAELTRAGSWERWDTFTLTLTLPLTSRGRSVLSVVRVMSFRWRWLL